MQTFAAKSSADLMRRIVRPPQRAPAVRQILRAPAVQTKLTVGAANDPAERQADKVADHVMRMPDSRGVSVGTLSPSQGPPAIGGTCAAFQGGEGMLNRRAAGADAPQAAPAIVHQVLRGPGRPLDSGARAFFEPRFGYNFSGVRVHTGNEAAQSARAVDASAYTAGQDIVLGEGQQTPGGAAGNRLMAHELAHVVQQGAGNAGTLQRELLPHVVPTKANQPAPSVAPQTAATAPVAATRWVHGSAGSISWIDPTSPAGSHIQDPRPGPTVSESDMLGGIQFRFSNYLHAWILTSDSVHVAKYGFHPDSGITRGPSYMKIPSMAYTSERAIRNVTENGIEGREFDQLVGARTISPGVAGGGIGALAGAVAGGLLLGPLGAIGGGLIGWLGGTATASRIWNFPPIWTRLRLRILANGTKSCRVLERSYFPSQSYYCDLARTGEYSALASQETQWENSGWGDGNPWGATRPLLRP